MALPQYHTRHSIDQEEILSGAKRAKNRGVFVFYFFIFKYKEFAQWICGFFRPTKKRLLRTGSMDRE